MTERKRSKSAERSYAALEQELSEQRRWLDYFKLKEASMYEAMRQRAPNSSKLAGVSATALCLGLATWALLN